MPNVSTCLQLLYCIAHMKKCSKQQRNESKRLKPSCRWIGGWTGAFALNALIATYFLIFGVGFGIWAAISNLASNVHQYSVFAKCYQVSTTQQLLLHTVVLDWASSFKASLQLYMFGAGEDCCWYLAWCTVKDPQSPYSHTWVL